VALRPEADHKQEDGKKECADETEKRDGDQTHESASNERPADTP
jgi:hypothetical protein